MLKWQLRTLNSCVLLLKITCILLIDRVYGVEQVQSKALINSSLGSTTVSNAPVQLTTLKFNSSETHNNSTPSLTAGLPLKSEIRTSPTPVASNASSTVQPIHSTKQSIQSTTSTRAVTTEHDDFLHHDDIEQDELKATKLNENPVDINDSIDVPQIDDSPKESHHNQRINDRYVFKEPLPRKTGGDRNRLLDSEDSFVERQYFSHVSTSSVLIICFIIIVLLLCIWKPLCHILYGIYAGYC
uniref:Uncharacterized protein n=1 Tax=Trichobilharzia regenti TaxID=157069 RepID=A0AA85J1R3_TRIRE|nr:unnamed protein product [Trichobilharzia regenti]